MLLNILGMVETHNLMVNRTVIQNQKGLRIIWARFCRTMMTKGMVFRYTWVYSKEDTMAHTCRPVVTS